MKNKIQIKSFLGKILFEFERENNTTKLALEDAKLADADLRYAKLEDADLRYTGDKLTHTAIGSFAIGSDDFEEISYIEEVENKH